MSVTCVAFPKRGSNVRTQSPHFSNQILSGEVNSVNTPTLRDVATLPEVISFGKTLPILTAAMSQVEYDDIRADLFHGLPELPPLAPGHS